MTTKESAMMDSINNDASVTFSPDTKSSSQGAISPTSIEEGVLAPGDVPFSNNHTRSLRHSASSRLSVTSKMYDIRGEGQLDETEQKMRAMDHDGRGYLTNAQVYEILQDHARLQTHFGTAKRLLLLFAVLLVILAVANIGIAFVAAKLAKDTTVQGDVLVVKGTDTSVATNSHADLYDILTTSSSVVQDDGNATNVVRTTIKRSDADEVYTRCSSGGSVNLVRTWPEYRFNDVISLCPADSYPRHNQVYTYAYASGENIEVDCTDAVVADDDVCLVSGSGLLQQVEQDCVYDQDCATGNCFFESWIPRGDPGMCKCLGDIGCASDETCVENECSGPNADSGNGNIVV